MSSATSRGAANDAEVSVGDGFLTDESDRLERLACEAELAHQGALNKVEKQKEHVAAAEEMAAALEKAAVKARKAADKAAKATDEDDE